MNDAIEFIETVQIYAFWIGLAAGILALIADRRAAKKPDPHAEPHGDVPHDNRL
ncbi:hypothetical protein [Prosthecomicrobium hirschii]|uniref:hypothetical protein n=1 Tax=Prosthecodimorpha hirschii TaxID=665126 RepID=UPI00221FB673|nr:hypothetical protein [Prosthecomicrobium hirschii]MCW1844163.1 hypothetical protein [Prosthecomicrobium hirschii]